MRLRYTDTSISNKKGRPGYAGTALSVFLTLSDQNLVRTVTP